VDVTTTASCPAENGVGSGPNVRSLQKPGLAVVDSGNVEIRGLEIRNFCIGVMLLRSHDNHIHHDLGVNGVTLNDLSPPCADAPDCDTGPNELQNFPVLSAGSNWATNGTITLQGSLASRPNATFTIEFFASHALNAAGFGEGEAYIGAATVTTDASGNATFSFVAPNGNPLHDGSTAAFFTTTATSAAGSTSEFSVPLSLAR